MFGLGAFASGGGGQNVVYQVGGRLDFGQRLHPALAFLGFRLEQTAHRAHPGMSVETLHFRSAQSMVKSVDQKSVELCTLHTVFAFAWHHITCLYVRVSRRASSARPRFILDLTVPSGTLRTAAISL